MLKAHKDDLICDLAETYNIYDYTVFLPRYIATLAAGLKDDSRTVQAVTGTNTDLTGVLLAQIATMLSGFFHEKPIDYMEIISGEKQEKELVGYDSPEEFWAARQAIIDKIK